MPQINQQQRYTTLSHLNKVDGKNKIEITLYVPKSTILHNKIDFSRKSFIVDKRSRFGDLENKTIKSLLPYKKSLHTITADNGKEFAFHEQIAKSLDISFYFARQYPSWVIGAIRRFN